MLHSMFDELKEVYKVTDFRIKHLKSLSKAEVYLEPKQASMI